MFGSLFVAPAYELPFPNKANAVSEGAITDADAEGGTPPATPQS